MNFRTLLPVTLLALLPAAASAQMRITEYMYQGANLEFIEFTNVGSTPVDLAGWSFSDSARVPGSVVLTSFGVVAAGESVILTENTEAGFRTAWSLAPTVKVIGDLTQNLSRNDEINLYDSGATLIDRLTYGDQTFPGTIRTQNISGWTSPGHLGLNAIADWQLSVLGDELNSYSSTGLDLGNPGHYFTPVPEPSTWALLAGAAALGLALWRRRA